MEKLPSTFGNIAARYDISLYTLITDPNKEE